ncbi:MAG TPA: hypothetical protein VN774_00825 [Candidatus Limnocylindrales bacterium]|nr:hypothetical protein [Candidatus Limnocylindrales bacterium]
MHATHPNTPSEPRENQFTTADVGAILRERGWLVPNIEKNEALANWLDRAASLLGPNAVDRSELASLLDLIFQYDAAAILRDPANHAVLGRDGARDVIRELALAVLEGPAVDSDRFKVIVDTIKEKVPFSSRELFHPLRLALVGRAGGGEFDRVILLLDSAASTPGLAPVKNNRERVLEFCAALE